MPVKKNAFVSRLSCTGPPTYCVSGGWSSGAGGAPSHSNAPVSQRPFWGRATPRASVSGHGPVPPSIAKLPWRGAWVSVAPPLSASASSSGFAPWRSRTPPSWRSDPGTEMKQV